MLAFLHTTNSSMARWYRRRTAAHVSDESPIMLGGCHRSGTTLLRVMLDAHPRIACGPETSVLAGSFQPEKLSTRFDIAVPGLWQLRRVAADHAHFIELFFRRYASERGKARWAEKTPQNVRHIGWILKHFPKAKFIHVIRDGRDVVCSIRTHPRFRMVDGQRVPTNIRRPIEPCISDWLNDTAAGMKWRGHPAYVEVRYENLVDSPERTLTRLCEFIGEPFDSAMLRPRTGDDASRDPAMFLSNQEAVRPISRHSLGRWRRDLTDDELDLVQSRAGARLTELGYRLDPRADRPGQGDALESGLSLSSPSAGREHQR